jgi:transcriptional regulator with XRE-family HTH domain
VPLYNQLHMGNNTGTKPLPRWAVKIKALRKKRGESQTVFGERFGVTKAAVSQWEAGLTEPSPDVILWVVENE